MLSYSRVLICCLTLASLTLIVHCAGGGGKRKEGRFSSIVRKNAANIKKRYSPEEIKKMSEKTFSFHPVGAFHSPLTPKTGAPRQGRLAPEVEATIEIFPKYEKCLEGLEAFSRLHVMFIFNRSRNWSVTVHPARGGGPRGLFSTRSPHRINPIGLTVVRLIKREGRILHVSGVDAYDNTPVVDIKPYVPRIDSFPEAKADLPKE